MDAVLESIKDFATKAHGAQTRKYSSEPFMKHPVRVMEMCRSYTNGLPVLAAALLHDVLEDTPVTQEEMHRFLCTVMNESDAQQTLQLVIELTDVFTKEAYPKWNRKKRKRIEASRIKNTSADSQTIKYADIIDNCKGIAQDDPEFALLFLKECKSLLGVMTKGNAELRQQSLAVINKSLAQVPSK